MPMAPSESENTREMRMASNVVSKLEVEVSVVWSGAATAATEDVEGNVEGGFGAVVELESVLVLVGRVEPGLSSSGDFVEIS
jgi:hypothetical protein